MGDMELTMLTSQTKQHDIAIYCTLSSQHLTTSRTMRSTPTRENVLFFEINPKT